MLGLSHLAQASEDLIHAHPQTRCLVCGSIGKIRYRNLTDKVFGALGRWNLSRCSHPRCGMLWLDPMPLAADIRKAYREYYTHDDVGAAPKPASGAGRVVDAMLQSVKRAYVATHLGYSDRQLTMRDRMLGVLALLDPTRRAETDFPLKYLPWEKRGRLLDVGCGSGELLVRMRSLGWRVEGVDFDPAAVAVARRKGLSVREGSLREQNFPDACFDAVVMSHVIEHVHEPRELLIEVRRILKPSGRLVIATPNASSLGHRILRDAWPFLDPPRHLQIFTPRALEAIVRAAGFDDVRVCTEIRSAAAMLPLLRTHWLWKTLRIKRIASRLFQYGENLALHFDADAGEEIALVAVR